MRRIVIILGIIVAVLILVIGGLFVFANPNSHRALIQSRLEDQLNRKVTLGDMSLGLFPLRFQVKQPVIAEDPALGQSAPFIRADALDIRVGLLPLLSGNIQVQSLTLQRPAIELVHTKKGDWSFSTLGPKTATAPPSGSSGSKTGAEVSLDSLKIVDGQIGVTDLQAGRSRATYDHMNITLTGLAPGKPFTVDLAGHIQGEGVDALLSGQSTITSQSETMSAAGKFKLDKARIHKVEVGYPITLDYKVASKAGLVTIDTATLQLGQTPLSVTGSLRMNENPVGLDLKVKSGDVSITEIARLAAAFGGAFPPDANVAGRVNANLQVRGNASRPAIDGTIGGHDLKISGAGLAQPVEVKALNVAVSPTTIQSDEFTATSGKSTVIGHFAMSQYTSDSPTVDLRLRAPAATLPEIQSITKAYGVNGLDQVSGTGSLNFDLNAKGPLQSLTSDAAMKSLNGVINLDFSPLKISGFDAAYELAKTGGFMSGVTNNNFTDVVKMTGKILVKDGIAQTDDLRTTLGIGSLSMTGNADLAKSALDLKLSTVFSKAFSEKFAATRAGGLLNVALTNSAGEIVLPALVTGSFKKPSFAPDLQAVAQLQKQKFLPTADNPLGAVGNLLGTLKPKEAAPATDDATKKDQKTDSPLKGLLKSLGKKPE